MSITYEPGRVPDEKDALILFLSNEFAAIKAALEGASVNEELVILHAAPTRTRKGMLVYADGTDWDPGSGAGVYRRNEANSAWVHLG